MTEFAVVIQDYLCVQENEKIFPEKFPEMIIVAFNSFILVDVDVFSQQVHFRKSFSQLLTVTPGDIIDYEASILYYYRLISNELEMIG